MLFYHASNRILPSAAMLPPDASVRRRRRQLLALGYCLSCLWNLASPFKSWYLARYGFVATNDILTLTLQWNTVLNSRLLTQLYAAAGIPLSAPLPPTRYINVFLDFVVVPRSQLLWAASFDATNGSAQLDVEGQSYRSGLDGYAERARFDTDISAFASSGFPLWGSEVITKFIPPQNAPTNLQEITEGVLCLRGINLEDYVYLVFQSLLQPYHRASDHAAVQAWRRAMFPHLNACLARRRVLVASATSTAAALTQLAAELATNFSVGLLNVAGSAQLYRPMTFKDGYIDLSGTRSGTVTYQISGPNPMHALSASSGFLNAMLVARETAWWCSIQYVDPVTNHSDPRQCFERFSSTLPSFFLGKYLDRNSGTRYLDSDAFTETSTLGQLTSYDYRRMTVVPLDAIRMATPGNLTGWNLLWKELLRAVGEDVLASDALEELCLVGDGCFSACANASASGGTTLTYRRGNTCVATADSIAHGLSDVFADMACFGLGHGQDAVLITSIAVDGTRKQATVAKTAGPTAIWACLIGGRTPQTSYPSLVVDLLTQGTQATLVVVKSNGSEAIVLNFLSLLALGGDAYFSLETGLYLRKLYLWYHAHRQLDMHAAQRIFSVVNSSVSGAIWARHRLFMRTAAFLGLCAWHLGAMQSGCAWADTIDDVSVDALYACHVDVWGHLASIADVLRLVSYSWNLFAMAFLDTMPGIAVNVAGYALAWLVLGLLPLTLLAACVAQMCAWRLVLPGLAWVHNQLFLVLLWAFVLGCLRRPIVQRHVVQCITPLLRVVRVRPQKLEKSSPYFSLIGPCIWIDTAEWRPEPTKYVPLSVLLECSNVRITNVIAHEYFACGLDDDARSAGSHAHGHPTWLHELDEYYVCVHACEQACYVRSCGTPAFSVTKT
ncbi:hypothetical protein SPRG_11587 [Saprolegnia parasitica CBS 223.65]|uniref:Uncharacterized protein n=1 Tax=Saprolegnia parasitica (strain CBS 223.65) TaxID=695850 RepID=A0A067BX37_SAPPC|nr:hypothetical protein SPRG_11587 [Saprolegnia parasitica CBS 223.65]KDO22828.1 hypothetical protein SPRG_11587 [Saprolegnia parasitica CBS 223.65]|eukprot:XP_012206499.1 hypothetical protein SPRG_11587 [Saprolegnia parasitica CBS 223.65]